ncbi:calcium-binding protein [Rhodococcus sp. SRB_17]|uniref:DUF937 domain-containing protein n=1 Tax=Acidovorax sp. SRB_24 TaxID=1962700 RepID=UPI00145D3689|nr:DUF937 domain-containing protein [Acidovorax sp. SRB_24]NMM78273.1 calcium-binding protein [Acidovorax sp. SRB_24]NMM87013.1 calcium-binding protein [Rhodococcus sp. SRB_17]
MNSPASLVDELMAHLQGAPLQQMAQQLGTSPEQTQNAVGTALPLLLGTLGRNAAQPQGAMDLFGALQRDHANSPDLGGLLGSLLGGGGAAPESPQTDGAGILGHIFGGNRQRAEEGLGQATGLGAGAGKLLQLLAPVVMAFLAKRMTTGGMDAGSLSETLGQERARAQQQGGLGGGLLGSLLDQDGDGHVGLSDLLKMGGGLLGGKR